MQSARCTRPAGTPPHQHWCKPGAQPAHVGTASALCDGQRRTMAWAVLPGIIQQPGAILKALLGGAGWHGTGGTEQLDRAEHLEDGMVDRPIGSIAASMIKAHFLLCLLSPTLSICSPDT